MFSEWNSPIRRAGGRSLDPIPLEIYLEVFSYISESEDMTAEEERRTLSNLALVCRYFSSLALPRIFSKVRLYGRNSGGPSQTMSHFCRALVNGQEPAKSMSQYVKSCEFVLWTPESGDSTHIIRSRNAFFTMYCTALSKMTHLKSLSCDHVSIDKRLLKAIRELKYLKSLKIMSSAFSSELCHGDIVTFAQDLKLETLLIDKTSTQYLNGFLDYQFLKTLVVDNWNIVEHLAGLPGNIHMENLTIHAVHDPCLLPKLFATMPELRQVHFYRIFIHEQDDLASLDFQSLVPKLCIVDCPAALAALLVPSRPIRKVWLTGTSLHGLSNPQFMCDTKPLDHTLLEGLQQTSAAIEEIAMPKHLYATGDLKAYMPSVLMLKLSWCHANWPQDIIVKWKKSHLRSEMQSLFGMWPPNPKVRYLTLDFHPYAETYETFLDLPLQLDILQNIIIKAFPNVEQVNFISLINWRLPFHNEGWKVYVPRTKSNYAYRIWNNLRDDLVDYGDCFSDVLKAHGAA